VAIPHVGGLHHRYERLSNMPSPQNTPGHVDRSENRTLADAKKRTLRKS
jgi:hypothetical protein